MPLHCPLSLYPSPNLDFDDCGARLPKCLSSLVSLNLLPALASGARLPGCLLFVFMRCLTFLLLLSGSPGVCLYVSSFMCLPLWLVVSRCPQVFSLLSLGSHPFSLTVCLPTHVSSITRLPWWWCLILSPVRICVCVCEYSTICFSPSVSLFTRLPIHVFPLVAVFCACFTAN